MSEELERLNRVLDALAAERGPLDHGNLTPDEVTLVETAAYLKVAAPGRSDPDPQFVERLAAQLASPPQPHHGTAATIAAGTALPGEVTARTGISRRRLLGSLAAAAAGAAAGAGGVEALRGHQDNAAAAAAYQQGYDAATRAPFTVPLAPDDRGAWFDTGHTVNTLRAGQTVRIRAGALEAVLVHPADGGPVYALSAACTHMGCMISWLSSTDTLLCPCHGAQYRLDGSVLSGVARQPLPRLRVRVDSEGRIWLWAVDEAPPVVTVLPYER